MITKVESTSKRVEAYILPKTVSRWPSFRVTKQISVSSPKLLFKRTGDSNSYRFNETVKLLCERRNVVSTGLAGVGKSTEVNSLLMAFLPNLGKDGWPKELWCRLDQKMIQFSLKEKARRVTIVPAKTLNDVLELTAQFENVRVIDELPVLLLELAEDEVNPRSYIPTYIPMSNRDVSSTTKELKKSGANYMLVDPPSCEDIQAMAVLEAKFSPENAVIKGDEEAVEKIVKERFDIVGPSLRSIFVDDAKFERLEKSLIGQASLLFSNLDKVSVDNMPKGASMFLGAFVEQGVEIPFVEKGSVRFLSNHIAKLIATVADKNKKESLVSNLFDYQIAETIMSHCLMKPSALPIGHVDKWSYNDWKFYTNPNPTKSSDEPTKVLSRHLMKENPQFPLCTTTTFFKSMYLEQDVSTLEERVLYKSCLHNGALFDALLVDRDNKKVYVFQSSSLRADKHSFNSKTVLEVMKKLKFDVKDNAGYTLVYVYCNDRSSCDQYRCVLNRNHDVENVMDKKLLNRLTILVARVCYYPQLPEVIIGVK
jgi:hypothetical protein